MIQFIQPFLFLIVGFFCLSSLCFSSEQGRCSSLAEHVERSIDTKFSPLLSIDTKIAFKAALGLDENQSFGIFSSDGFFDADTIREFLASIKESASNPPRNLAGVLPARASLLIRPDLIQEGPMHFYYHGFSSNVSWQGIRRRDLPFQLPTPLVKRLCDFQNQLIAKINEAIDELKVDENENLKTDLFLFPDNHPRAMQIHHASLHWVDGHYQPTISSLTDKIQPPTLDVSGSEMIVTVPLMNAPFLVSAYPDLKDRTLASLSAGETQSLIRLQDGEILLGSGVYFPKDLPRGPYFQPVIFESAWSVDTISRETTPSPIDRLYLQMSLSLERK